MPYIVATLLLWTGLIILVGRKNLKKYYPVLIFTALLGTTADLCGYVFRQWVYHGPVVGGLSIWSDLGIAPAEGGIFIRLFPAAKGLGTQGAYLMAWSFINALLEWIFVKLGWIGYYQWRPARAFLFYIIFFGLVWVQEYWYNGTDRLRDKEN